MIGFTLLFVAGVCGGMVNTLAGGGSFITFPALLAVGVPPVMANASNTFASTAGYLSGAWALRGQITVPRARLMLMAVLSALFGGVGAWVLTQTSNNQFQTVIPWLLLFATLLFISGGAINRRLQLLAISSGVLSKMDVVFWFVFVGIAIYGGFFNAGLGILLLSYLSLAGYSDVNEMNALKLLCSAMISSSAILIFVVEGLISVPETGVLLLGTLVGGYAAGALSTRLSQRLVRNLIILVSSGITVYFFIAA